ncbi:PGF-pre-PGF domain-containing protein [Methanolobus zinderi]|uniref:PGF-pre-PGF domain-containing protein n=1 Tax=Methanolobus zinderi TaxID=536044 RepID=A0A7D5EAU2_9EURY|nr:PGF-pre-PGF domain-containing protein [Methanolobus zinderi]
MESNDVDHDAILLYNYHDKWIPLDTEKVDEDEEFVYYTSETLGFSIFAISSMDESTSVSLPAARINNSSEGNTSLLKNDPSGQDGAGTFGDSVASYALTLLGLVLFLLWAVGFVLIKQNISFDEIGPQLRSQGGEVIRRLRR